MPLARVAVPREIADEDPDLALAIARDRLARFEHRTWQLARLHRIPDLDFGLSGVACAVYQAELTLPPADPASRG